MSSRIEVIHQLLNELHKELLEIQDDPQYPQLFFNHADEIQDIAMKVDALHHDFTNEIQSASG